MDNREGENMVFIQLAFLGYLLYTAEKYLIMKISSREHRLLPVILVLAGLYNFYRVVECVTDSADTFELLEQLLVMQAVFGVIHYKKDFMHLKFFRGAEVLFFIVLILADISMILCYQRLGSAGIPYRIGMALFLVVLFCMNFYIKFFMNMKKREKMVGYTLYISFLIVIAALIITPFIHHEWSALLTPFSLFIIETQLNRLMKNGYIVDSNYLLKNQLFNSGAVMTALFDEDYYLIDVNEAAEHAVMESKWDIEISYTKQYIHEIDYLINRKDSNEEVKLGKNFFRVHIAKVNYMNRLRGYVVNLIDLTEEKEENLLMESLKREAESAAQLKGRFLASMSHELRSPLHAIIGYCDILNRQKDISERYHKMIGSIKSAGNTLLRVVNSILDYSKMEAGKLEIKHQEYDFQAVLHNLLLESLINKKTKPIDISVVMATPYPRILIGDELRVWDIIQNLMSNAVKYTEKGSITCTVSCEILDDESIADESEKLLDLIKRVRITISVADTGSGMSEELIEKVFDEYQSYAANLLMEGTGLGLNIVKYSTELLGGGVEVHSDGVSGTEFVVHFYQDWKENKLRPARKFTELDVDANDEPVAVTTMDGTSQIGEGGSEDGAMLQPEWFYPDARILSVDDMEVNLNLFQEFTDIWHITVDTADNGMDAIELVHKNSYDMVFLDNMMPGMKGIEAASIIRTFSDVPIYILTADISQETKEKSMENGATELLDKPLKLEELKRVLETGLPEELRRPVHGELPVISPRRMKVLQTYVRETTQVAGEINKFWEDKDLDNFRIKVHGVKGTSRGIIGGQQPTDDTRLIERLAELAETMEMAAKVDNRNYIDRHIDELGDLIAQAVAMINAKLDELGGDAVETTQTAGKPSINDILLQLQKAFDEFDLDGIESGLDSLEQSVQEDGKKELVQKLRACGDQLEYEEGSRILAGLIKEKERK